MFCPYFGSWCLESCSGMLSAKTLKFRREGSRGSELREVLANEGGAFLVHLSVGSKLDIILSPKP